MYCWFKNAGLGLTKNNMGGVPKLDVADQTSSTSGYIVNININETLSTI